MREYNKMGNEQINKNLISAVQQLNIEQVQKLLKQGADVNYARYIHPNAQYLGNTYNVLYDALHASLHGKDEKVYVDIVELLLKNGAQVDARMEYLVTRLKDQTQKIRFVNLFIDSVRKFDLLTIMGNSGLRSKMRQFKQLVNNDQNIQKIAEEKEIELREEFEKEYPHMREEQQENQQNNTNNEYVDEDQKKVPEVDFILTLLQIGVSMQSSSSTSYKPNEQQFYYKIQRGTYSKSDEQLSKEDYIREQYIQYETALHRTIMNNTPEIVKALLNKGADASENLKYTMILPFFPNQWPEKLKQRKIKENLNKLKQSERHKRQLEEKLKQNQSQLSTQQVARTKQRLIQYAYQIFCAQRFSVQNECPIGKYINKEIGCLELAEKMQVSSEIIEMLRKSDKCKMH